MYIGPRSLGTSPPGTSETPEAAATETPRSAPSSAVEPDGWRTASGANATLLPAVVLDGLPRPEVIRVGADQRFASDVLRHAQPVIQNLASRAINEDAARRTVDFYRNDLQMREGAMIVVSIDQPNYDGSDQEQIVGSRDSYRRMIPMRGETFVFQVRNGELIRLAADQTFITSTVPTMNMSLWDNSVLSQLFSRTQRSGPAMIANGVYDVRRGTMATSGLPGFLFENAGSIPAFRDSSYEASNPATDGTFEAASTAGEIFAHTPVASTVGCIALHDVVALREVVGNARLQWIIHRTPAS